MSTEVKYLHSSMTGAPTLSGQAGTLIAVLDACLVNGFGLGTVDSVVIAGGVATVTRASGHPFEVDSIALIAGGSVSGGGSINGEKRVLSVTGVSYTFDATGISDQTATGTITHKTAPAGWQKEFNATNLAVYKSVDVASTQCRLRVDDTGTDNARIVAYKTMSDVNTGIDMFPTAADVSGGSWQAKSVGADATTRPWIIVADGRAFYLAVQWHGTGYGMSFYGDFVSNKSPDPYAFAVMNSNAAISADLSGGSAADVGYSNSANNLPAWAARSSTGFGVGKYLVRSAAMPLGNIGYFSGSTWAKFIAYPNPADNGLYLTPMMLSELTPNAYRGRLPGFHFAPQAIGASVFATREKVSNVAGLTGRTLVAINNTSGPSFIDITGPWR